MAVSETEQGVAQAILVVRRSLKLFNSNKKRKGKKKPTWEVVKGPRQPNAKQCGFYVMKFIREIIEGNATRAKDSLISMVRNSANSCSLRLLIQGVSFVRL
ncbi:uncharacterized protein LOC122028882 [Zingiber officinale]|uniref:uncharacterized protein LOC122028882 n=1 Tax=Zingiber officinale TaxID=94328 RepID=UPI001C4C0195|nr:uncharacterized protein LOC122028882 [Zingiber officinale]XP_042443766.1 uncharacterized protein LOC122028882 [Zingiber officinale]